MKYTILIEYSTDELIQKVEEYMKNGWVPIGGLVVSLDYMYYQTMIKTS